MRQIILDTETTGIDPKAGHRIIEIGCVEMIDRKLTGNTFHVYINPQRDIEQEAIDVHGITSEFLSDKPLFADVADDFFAFVNHAELIIHNAPFDIGFLDHELALLNRSFPNLRDVCGVIDTLVMAREKHPGARNNLDALCSRYFIDNSKRELHGALLDSEILADVYLAMTGGQTVLDLMSESGGGDAYTIQDVHPVVRNSALKVIRPSADELAAHEEKLNVLDSKSGGETLFRKLH